MNTTEHATRPKRIGIEWHRVSVHGRTYRRIAPFYEGPQPQRTLARIAAVVAVVAFIASLFLVPDVQF